MAPQKTTPPVLEGFHGIKKATELLGLSDPNDPDDKTGQRWLRDGVNLKGYPHQRMAGYLVFSDSDLIEIARLNRNPATRPGRRPRRPRKVAAVKQAPTAQSNAA